MFINCTRLLLILCCVSLFASCTAGRGGNFHEKPEEVSFYIGSPPPVDEDPRVAMEDPPVVMEKPPRNMFSVAGYKLNVTKLNDMQEQEWNGIIYRLQEHLQKYPESKISIQGHTCNIGSQNANYIIGLKRAQAIEAYLTSKKDISKDRILEIRSIRDTQPLRDNADESSRKMNRRVDLIVE
jgi:outer membrane protein OmpA-like peptidoglycan-associated protein